MKSSGIVYYYEWHKPVLTRIARTSKITLLGLGILAFSFGGLFGPFAPQAILEARYAWFQSYGLANQPQTAIIPVDAHDPKEQVLPAFVAPFDPLKLTDGSTITPASNDFSLIVPKIGINSAVIPTIDPAKPDEYLPALKKGIAHSSLSYLPDEDGTVYLFSHSTNYDWFVNDLNAVFYLLKNLEPNDRVIVVYNGISYLYEITDKKIVSPSDVDYLVPKAGQKRLILQTCWPPGSTTERLLIFADLVPPGTEEI